MRESGEHDSIRAIQWLDGRLCLLDQRLLPFEERHLYPEDAAAVCAAIRNLVVRGAPAIGITAAYGVVLAAQVRRAQDLDSWRERLEQDIHLLATARPTAVNLSWALQRMQRCLEQLAEEAPVAALLEQARRIHAEDIAANHSMGEHGAGLLRRGDSVLTYCNTGSLATGGFGTALGVIRSAWNTGKMENVYACETRPWLQGARLTAWELVRDRIPVTLLTDNSAAILMQGKYVQWVITGADRITANGDVINKIGTYNLAISCHHHGLQFMVVAPCSTLDFTLDSGQAVEIEQRAADEILTLGGVRVAAEGASAWNPVFDVTPAGLVDYLVTERGVIAAPDRQKLAALQSS
jgi:methylthioribose-1-phosphate isomerase